MDEDPPFVADRPLARQALHWADSLHRGQRRDVDEAPFVLHPAEVAMLLSVRGYDDEVVAAGCLHDAVENTHASVRDVRARFGNRVAEIVAAVTDDPSIDGYRERKAALRAQVAAADADAHAVFAADKLVKTRELRAIAARAGGALDDPSLVLRREHYEESLRMLEQIAPRSSLVRQLAFELWAMRSLPPAGPRPAAGAAVGRGP